MRKVLVILSILAAIGVVLLISENLALKATLARQHICSEFQIPGPSLRRAFGIARRQSAIAPKPALLCSLTDATLHLQREASSACLSLMY
jgi:hypothetical protein